MSRNFFPRPSWHLDLSEEALALLLAGYFSLTATTAFWRMVVDTGALAAERWWITAASLGVLILAGHALLLGLLLFGRLARPLAAALLLLTAAAAYFMQRYSVFLDDDMLRNILHSDTREASELVSPGLLVHVALFGGLPALALGRVRIRHFPWPLRLLRRLLFLLACGALGMTAMAASQGGVASFLRNHKPLRELLAPGNYLSALWRVARSGGAAIGAERLAIGRDARRPASAVHAKPKLLVLVLGETVRAQNWGLNGYARMTTPELARRAVLNFSDVTSCGTATEVSVPCLFSPEGSRGYDRERLRHSESLLHVLQRVGVDVLWRDNQTGCKGVCSGLAFEDFESGWDSRYCSEGVCRDEAMIDDLEDLLGAHSGDFVLVLHQLGNHGPAYFRRYPAEQAHWLPECRDADLSLCDTGAIRNAYDNAILYTDHLLATLIDRLARHPAHATAMLYVSDHGESLGEHGLYLHGMPMALAPETQRKVPMLLWMDESLWPATGIDAACMRRKQDAPLSHDYVFHSVLGWFDVQTALYRPDYDLFADCRRTSATAGSRVMAASVGPSA